MDKKTPSWERHPLVLTPASDTVSRAVSGSEQRPRGSTVGSQQIFAINQLSGWVYSLPKLTSGINGDAASFMLQTKIKSSNVMTDKQCPVHKVMYTALRQALSNAWYVQQN